MARSPAPAMARSPAAHKQPAGVLTPPPGGSEVKVLRFESLRSAALGWTLDGLLVTAVLPGGPADRAGATPGMLVVEVNGQRARASSLTRALLGARPTFTVTVRSGRGDSRCSSDIVSPPATPPDEALGAEDRPPPAPRRPVDLRPGGCQFDHSAGACRRPQPQRQAGRSAAARGVSPTPRRSAPRDQRVAARAAPVRGCGYRSPSPMVGPPRRSSVHQSAPSRSPKPEPLPRGARVRAKSANVPPPAAPKPRPLPPQGIWVRQRLLGKGTYGSVYLGRMTDTKRVVAVKEIEVNVASLPAPQQARELEMLEREVTLMRSLEHDHVVRMYACCEGRSLADMPCIWIFMECMEGGSLGAKVRNRRDRAQEPEVVPWVAQIVSGVAYLHSKGIVHRDLKGDNVLLGSEGQVKVSDFGTAKKLTAATGLPATGARTVIGTPLWMAPEVFNSGAEGRGYTSACDVWSIGIVACELLNRGRAPWPHFDSVWAAVWEIGGWTEQKGLPPGVPSDLSAAAMAFIAATLAVDPRRRTSCSDLRSHAWLQQAGVAAAAAEPADATAAAERPDAAAGAKGAGGSWADLAEAAEGEREQWEERQAAACDALRTSGLLPELDTVSRQRHRRSEQRAACRRERLRASQASLARSMDLEREIAAQAEAEAEAESRRQLLEKVEEEQRRQQQELVAAADRKDATAAAARERRRAAVIAGRLAREAHCRMEDLKGRLRVVARVRGGHRGPSVLDFPSSDCRVVTVQAARGMAGADFVFDRVFGADATQRAIWEEGPRDLCAAAVDGSAVCILAYGQTGSGKTHTIVGSAEVPGVTRSALEQVFAKRPPAGSSRSVRASCIELGADGFTDLLAPPAARKKLGLRQGPSGVVDVHGTTELPCENARELLAAFTRGAEGRVVRGTLLNDRSSRTHMLFTVVIQTSRRGAPAAVGRMCFCDLAGSERPSRSGVSDEGLREAVAINQSLTALGNCIEALAQGRGFVPWRAHDLTHFLSRYLGGSGSALFVACVSADVTSARETKSTLAFAQRAKMVQLVAPAQLAARREAIIQQERLVRELDSALQDADEALVEAELQAEAAEEDWRGLAEEADRVRRLARDELLREL